MPGHTTLHKSHNYFFKFCFALTSEKNILCRAWILSYLGINRVSPVGECPIGRNLPLWGTISPKRACCLKIPGANHRLDWSISWDRPMRCLQITVTAPVAYTWSETGLKKDRFFIPHPLFAAHSGIFCYDLCRTFNYRYITFYSRRPIGELSS